MPDQDRKAVLSAPLSAPGAAVGALFFLASLTPSLIPRIALAQGALGGIALAVGHALAAGLAGLAVWLGIRAPGHRNLAVYRLALAAAALIVLYALSRAAGWQNDVRAALDMPPVESARPLVILAVAGLVALLPLGLGRLFRLALGHADRPLGRHLPPRIGFLAAFTATAALFWTIANGVLLERGLSALDRTYQAVDGLIDLDLPAPADVLKTGSAASLIGQKGSAAKGATWWRAIPIAPRFPT